MNENVSHIHAQFVIIWENYNKILLIPNMVTSLLVSITKSLDRAELQMDWILDSIKVSRFFLSEAGHRLDGLSVEMESNRRALERAKVLTWMASDTSLQIESV